MVETGGGGVIPDDQDSEITGIIVSTYGMRNRMRKKDVRKGLVFVDLVSICVIAIGEETTAEVAGERQATNGPIFWGKTNEREKERKM